MSIGKFAQLCRLSVKALRHYDELGLLAPAAVDASTGYRSYRRSQVRRALTISMLRELDVPLASVSEILEGGAARAFDALRAEAERQSKEAARRNVILASLERLVRERTLSPYQIEVVDAPARGVAKLTVCADVASQEAVTTEAIRRLMSVLDAAGGWSDPVLCRFLEETKSGEMVLEIAVGVGDDGPLELPADVSLARLAPGREAMVRHVGPYGALGLAHHALCAWARERGEAEAGALYEVYLNDPDEVAADELMTEVRLPLGGVAADHNEQRNQK